MKFKTTKGREVKIDIRPSKWPRRDKSDSKSYFQWKIGQEIDKIYPSEVILEEFSIPGENLRIDFFIPRKRVAIEIMGEQHYKYNKFFHKDRESFLASKARDARKRQWCNINDIKIIYVEDYLTHEDIEHLISDS